MSLYDFACIRYGHWFFNKREDEPAPLSGAEGRYLADLIARETLN